MMQPETDTVPLPRTEAAAAQVLAETHDGTPLSGVYQRHFDALQALIDTHEQWVVAGQMLKAAERAYVEAEAARMAAERRVAASRWAVNAALDGDPAVREWGEATA